jgi:uncharacterized protein YaaR (DUF327 family)
MSYEILQATGVVLKQIDEKVKQLEEAIGRKAAKSFDEYCEMCGEIKGLLTARNFITDLTKRMEQLDE